MDAHPIGTLRRTRHRRRRLARLVAPLAAALALAGAAAEVRAQGEPAPGTPDPRELAAAAASTPEPRAARAAGFAVAGAVDRPPPPLPPAVIARDAQRRATVRAVKLAAGLRLDGRLDEPVYRIVPAIDDFIQQEPDEGAPGTERTEVWILFDTDNIYVAGRVWDSAPPAAWVANEMRRDTSQLRENDTLWVAFDTFNDRRNGVAFYTNPLGALGDFQITNEGNPNGDWNPVWDVRTGRFEGGWTVEMEIPFKSLRYKPEAAPVWGGTDAPVGTPAERTDLPHAGADLHRSPGVVPGLRRRATRGTGAARRGPRPRRQAVRHRRQNDDRRGRRWNAPHHPRRRRRPRRQVRA